jgi:hypothetical protein
MHPLHPYIMQGLMTARADDRRRAAAAAQQAQQARLAYGRPRFLGLGFRRARRPARPAVPVAYRAMSR